MIVIDAEGLSAARPQRPLFSDLSITVSDGDRIGVVGINGCGKSTLLRLLARVDEPASGEVRWGRGARVGFLAQRPELPSGLVADALGDGWQGRAMLDRLGMGHLVDASTDTLSGGQAKRVALARLLAGEYEALILDEPTNHLDLGAIRFLEEWLAAYRGGLVLVTHDRHVLDRVTTRVLEIDRGTGYLHVPEGWTAGSGYAAYLAGRAERAAREEAAEQVRRNLAARELAWLRRGAPARTSKPKARIATATALVQGRPQAAARDGALGLGDASLGPQRLGSKGIEAVGLTFGYDPQRPVLSGCALQFEPGDRVGIVGPNGVGKSTLLDLLAGRLTPQAGEVQRGTTVRIGYYDQMGRALDPQRRVRELVAGDKVEPSLADVALMRRFWFDGDAQFAPVGTLSGGERRRLQLLLTLVEQPNVLFLDEPTNDLDLDTLRALEDFLDDWPGIVVAVSHDRSFLDRVTDELLALDGRGGVRWVRGGVAAWLAESEQTTAAGSTVSPSSGRSTGPSTGAPASRAHSTKGQAPAPSARATTQKPTSGSRSPSTIRRQLGQAERDLDRALASRADAEAELASIGDDHQRMSAAATRLADAQAAVDAAESAWLTLADEAEAAGLST